MHGTCIICPVLQPSGDNRVEVLNFIVHPLCAPTTAKKLAVTRLGLDMVKLLDGSQLVCKPSMFPMDNLFAKQVITELPYCSVPAPGQHDQYVRYMIDKQRLLRLKVHSPRKGLCFIFLKHVQ
jgi:hypothetical protein